MGDSTRLVQAIGQIVKNNTTSGAGIDYRYGIIVDSDGITASAYISGDTETAWDEFMLKAGDYVESGDYVQVSIDSRGHRWVEKILPYSDYPMMVLDSVRGVILTGDGDSIPSIPFTSGGGGGGTLTDGDKTDITVTSSGAVWTIDNNVVNFAKMQNISTDSLIGRDTASTGDPEEISVGGGLEFTGSSGVQRSALTGDVTASAGSSATTLAAGNAGNLNSGTLLAARMPALTGDVTTSAGAVATTIANDAVTYAKMQNIATDSLVGRDTASSGDPETISVSGGLEFTGSGGVQRSALTGDVTASAGSGSTTLAHGNAGNLDSGTLLAARMPALTGDVTTSAGAVATTIANDAVTYAKMQNIATDSLVGRDTASTGDPETISVSGGLEFTGSAGIQRSALTGDVTASAGSNATTLAAGNAANLNSGTLLAARMPALTGDITTSAGAVATTIANDAVTYAKMQNVSATSRILGRITAGAGDPEELTAANLKTIAGYYTSGDSPSFATVTTTGGIELGNASDTTIARSGAGTVTIEGVEVARNTTSQTHTASTIELGNASDTTLSRASGGQLAVEGVNVSMVGHGAADHADITRHFWLEAGDAKLDSGTAVTLGAVPSATAAIALADGPTTASGCYWTVGIPSDYTSGNLSFRPIWAPGSTDGSSHAVRWSLEIKAMINGTDVTAAGTTTAFTGISQANTANIEMGVEADTDGGVSISNANQTQLKVSIRRLGTNAADTYVGVVNLLGIRVSYTANQ